MKIPLKYQKLYKRAMGGKARNAAVRVFCLQCVGWEYDAARTCTSNECPLYPYRPGRKPPKERKEPSKTAT